MDCTSLLDRDGELFRYTYCFFKTKMWKHFGKLFCDGGKFRYMYQIIIKRSFESSGFLEVKLICS